MQRSPQLNRPPDETVNPADDPWSEFLSEGPDASGSGSGEDAAIAQRVANEPLDSVIEQPIQDPPDTSFRHLPSPSVGGASDVERTIAARLGVPAVPPEPPKPALVPVRRALPVSHGQDVVLSDLLAARVPIHWSESVAVVQELCDVLQRRGDAHPLIPDISQVFITPDGSVQVPREAGGERDIRSLGRLLHTLLAASSNPPLPLRLFVTSSVSSTRFQSVELFADALSHYTVAGRQSLIRALYQRSLRPSDTIHEYAPAIPPVRRKSGFTPTTLAVVLGALALMAASAGGTWYAMTARFGMPDAVRSADAPAPAVEAADPADVPPATETPARRDPWQPGRIAIPPTRRERAVPPPAQQTQAPVSRTPLPAVVPPAPRPVMVAPAQISQPFQTVAAPRPSAAVASATDNVGTSGRNVEDPTVYSRSDYDVQPPQLLTPPLSPALGPTGSTYTIEVIVNERGIVESVRMPDRPRTMQDSSVLPAAKMSRFKPALKNGVPVKYRLEMSVARTAG
jgi:hypothetical protein